MLAIRVDEEIVLRVPVAQDAETLYEVVDRNRAYLGKWLDFIPKTANAEDTRRVISRWQEQAEQESDFSYVIEYQGRIVGSGGATGLDESKNLLK